MRILLARAGALGDTLLLRRAIAAIHHRGHEPALLVPRTGGCAIVGPGGSEVEVAADLDGAWLAGGMGGDDRPLEPLCGFGAALALTRSQALVATLERQIPRVLVRDPLPVARHAALWAADPLEELGCPTANGAPPDLIQTAEENEASAPILDRLGGGAFLAIHPGSGSAGKNWPEESFGALVTHLTAGRPWLLVRGPGESLVGSHLERLAGAVSLVDCPLRTLAAALRHAALFVGNDSGVTHLAAASGAPVVTLFGPTDPALWAPVGRSVTIVKSPTARMADLSVEAVRRAAEGAWQDSTAQ